MTSWKMQVSAANGTGRRRLDDFSGAQWTWPLTGSGSLKFGIAGDALAAGSIDGLATDVWLYEDTTLRQRFRVLPVEQAWSDDGSSAASIQAIDYAGVVARRHLHTTLAWPEGSEVDQGTMIWEAVEHVQTLPGGDLGITQGVTTTGIDRARTWAEGQMLGKLFEDLENVINGPTWGIGGDRVLWVKMPNAYAVHQQPLQQGVNATGLKRRPGQGFANSGRYAGDNEATTPVWADDAGIATDPRGRWEVTGGNNSVTVQDTVQDHAEGLVEAGMRPPAIWSADVDPDRWATDSRYTPGLFVGIRQPADIIDPIGHPAALVGVQITEVTISFDGDGASAVSITGIEVP